MVPITPTNVGKLCCNPLHPFTHSCLSRRGSHSQKPGLGPRLIPCLVQKLWVPGPMHSGPQRKAPSVQGLGVSQSALSPKLHNSPVMDRGPPHPVPWALEAKAHSSKHPPPSLSMCPPNFFPNLVKRGSERVASGWLRYWTHPQNSHNHDPQTLDLELYMHFTSQQPQEPGTLSSFCGQAQTGHSFV